MNLAQVVNQLLLVYQQVDQAKQVAMWLLEKLTGRQAVQLWLEQDLCLTSAQQALLTSWLEQIVDQNKPYQYILGSVPFLNIDILVEPPVLIPRLETEWWVGLLIDRLKQVNKPALKILDLCSGSGCIGLALAKAFADAQVTAVDIAPQACSLIIKNKLHNQINNLVVQQGDLYNNLAGHKFDIIVSNPPYIPAKDYATLDLSVRQWEDRGALVAPGDDLAIIDKIIRQAPAFLLNSQIDLPRLWIEIDFTQAEAVNNLMKLNFNETELKYDQFARPRVIIGK